MEIDWGVEVGRSRLRTGSVSMRSVVLVAVFGSVLGGGVVPLSPIPATAATSASSALESLSVSDEHLGGYDDRVFFRDLDLDGDGCSTRQEVLIAESLVPVTMGSDCSVVSGEWFSPYDAVTWTNPSDVDIDHLVALAEAWRSGASSWTDDQRRSFTNDVDYGPSLIAVTDNVNSSKGDSDPAEWMPPAPAYRCTYVAEWIQVKYRWGLSVDPAEKQAIGAVLREQACVGLSIELPEQLIAPQPTTPTTGPTTAPSGQIVYRFWSPQNRSHFFTISLAERDQVILNYPASMWTYEGAAYEAYTSQQPGTVPLFRFWSTAFGGHFYTTSEAERQYVDATYDDFTWRYEGVAYYVYPVGATFTGVLDVARFWSPNNRHHFYTASAAEASHVRSSYPAQEWSFEGVSFVVPATLATPPPPPTRPTSTNPSPPPTTTPGNPGDSKNCPDFANYSAAKSWFDTYYPYYGDVARLDRDNDLIPCEDLPGAPR